MSKETKTNAMRILDKLKIPYELLSYDCEKFESGQKSAEILGLDPETTFKTIVTVGKNSAHYVFVLPVNLEMDMKKCAKAVGEKTVETIHVKDIQAVTGYVRGGCSPIGMKKQFRTVVHESAKTLSAIAVSGGRPGVHLLLSPADLIDACAGEYADIAALREITKK